MWKRDILKHERFEYNKSSYSVLVFAQSTPVLLYKSGVLGGQNYTGMFSWCDIYNADIIKRVVEWTISNFRTSMVNR